MIRLLVRANEFTLLSVAQLGDCYGDSRRNREDKAINGVRVIDINACDVFSVLLPFGYEVQFRRAMGSESLI
ncbi:hypothetical protein L1286_06825 [Pseudoalteromonas sp. SMS1]|uniref:hypothetical protein n=1 Tax=Pseudoalteromonas sp. SMS1 TaxID=2908894 RepID=UPI001F410AC7|nr:hypothetical protein [Pseudoalteromonas sp. SMS1]MCF2857174.1 hypothetical protein [Pseudoalteromonas sp. SMS1]